VPFAAKRPCRGGCGRLVSFGYCEACQAKGKGKDRRPSAAKRGYGGRWRKASAGYLQKHPLCVDPYKRHPDRVVAATNTDHVIPHKGDMKLFWDPDNWQGLCDGCHSYKTAIEDGGFGH
jgi:5-methylcytosine-specific restriction enzyme A